MKERKIFDFTTKVKEMTTGPYLWLKSRELIRDCKQPDSIQYAADALAKGEIIGFPMCGVMGLVCDGQNLEAIYKIFEAKGRESSRSLIVGASNTTRQRLVEWEKIHPNLQKVDWDRGYDLPTFLIFPSCSGLFDEVTITIPNFGKTVAVFWANFYNPVIELEKEFLKRKPGSFLTGSSANITNMDSITTARDVFNVFHNKLAVIVKDSVYEKTGLTKGTHTILNATGDKIRPHRGGPIHTESFRKIYGDLLEIPDTWSGEKDGASILDIDKIRSVGHYLRV